VAENQKNIPEGDSEPDSVHIGLDVSIKSHRRQLAHWAIYSGLVGGSGVIVYQIAKAVTQMLNAP
jgi:hypothetical protein